MRCEDANCQGMRAFLTQSFTVILALIGLVALAITCERYGIFKAFGVLLVLLMVGVWMGY